MLSVPRFFATTSALALPWHCLAHPAAMSYTVSVCAGLVGNEVRYLQDVEGSTPLASILNLSGQLRPCPKAWLTENVLVHGASTYSLQQLIEERITLHDIGTLENSYNFFHHSRAASVAVGDTSHSAPFALLHRVRRLLREVGASTAGNLAAGGTGCDARAPTMGLEAAMPRRIPTTGNLACIRGGVALLLRVLHHGCEMV